MKINYPVIDLHTHLRNDIFGHTKIAKDNGISGVVYMANTSPVLDNLDEIKKSLKARRNCISLPVSAITKNLDGKELVDIDSIRDYVVGFSDDGKYLGNMDLLAEILKKDVLVMAHCSPTFEKGIKNPDLETKYIEKYLKILEKVGGKLHIQHISKKGSVKIIRKAKEKGIKVTCETCPYYFTFTAEDLNTKTNPPLGNFEDVIEIRKGLADGTIDVVASDYAPMPRETGIAGFNSFLSLSYGLVLSGILTEKQLKEKISKNPLKIIQNNCGSKLKVLCKKIPSKFVKINNSR